MTWKERYYEAHKKHTTERTPSVVKDGHYCNPALPKVQTANGLTLLICNYINWMGYRATRISTTGRQVGGRWIYGTTRKGTADISATIKGRAVQIEIKVGKDKPSEYQLKEQEKERKSGGIYEFVSNPEQFFELYDYVMNL